MNYFSIGCCDDASELLSFYLNTEYNIKIKEVMGDYKDDNPNNTFSHTWLLYETNIILDITYSQFYYLHNDKRNIYIVLKKILFIQCLKVVLLIYLI